MIDLMIKECDVDLVRAGVLRRAPHRDPATVARVLTLAESGRLPEVDLTPRQPVPVLGITGTGGSEASSLTDELLRRFRRDPGGQAAHRVLAVDPTHRRGGERRSATGSG
jgi:methylmalonyl-CoA mutase